MSSKHRKKDTSVKKEKKKVLPRLGDGYLAAIPLCSLGLDLALSDLRLGAHNASTLHLFPPDTLLHTSHSVRFDVPATTDSGELLRTPKLSTYKPLALLFVQFIRFLNQSVKGASLSVIAASGNATLLQDALADKSLSFAYLEDVSMLLQLRYACVEPVKRVLAEHGPVPTEYSLQQAQQYLGFAEEWIEHALPCFHSDILVKAREFLQGIYSPSVQHDSYLHDDDPDDPPPRSTPPPVYQWQLYPSDSRPATPASSSSPASSNAGSRHDGHRTKDRSTSKKTARPTEPQPRTISLTEFVFGPKRPKKGKKKDHKQSRG
ncbi:hypothetical protein JCM10207_008950 [Rhodosporidiobolus poonsookiae]